MNRKLLASQTVTLLNAMELINQNGVKSLVIADDNGLLIGIVSDGDIRRAILNGADLNAKLLPFINIKPITVENNSDISLIRHTMEIHDLQILPVIDESNHIVDIFTRQTIASKLNEAANDCVALIMAGGFGSRLAPITNKIPKPLVEIEGKPIIESLVMQLSRAGFKRIFIAVHYLHELIIEKLGSGNNYDCEIIYLIEESPKGTGGALNLLPPDLKEKCVILCNADLVGNFDFSSMLNLHLESGKDFSVVSTLYVHRIPYGILNITDSNIIGIIEKPTCSHPINAGIYFLTKSAIPTIFRNQDSFAITDLFSFLGETGKDVNEIQIEGYWSDVGTLESLNRTRIEVRGNVDF